MDTYCLIDAGHMPRWSILTTHERTGELVWMDQKGRRTPYEEGRVIGHCSGRNFEQAMQTIPEDLVRLEQAYAYRYLIDPWSNQGWIDRSGLFFGCAFYAHDDVAYSLIRRPTMALEWEGWVRVHADFFRRPESAELTKRQEATLVKLGFERKADGFGFERARKFEIDRSGPPPRYAATMPADLMLLLPEETVEEMFEIGLDDLVAQLREDHLLSSLFDVAHEQFPENGPGTWDWRIEWDGLHIGSEEPVEELLGSRGFHFARTSYDTIEISSWPMEELVMDSGVRAMIEREASSASLVAPAA